MTDRSDRVRLPAGIARCEPSGPCTMKARCARAQAYIPTHGASMRDFSVHTTSGGTALCPGYVSMYTLHTGPAAAPKPVRPAVRGL